MCVFFSESLQHLKSLSLSLFGQGFLFIIYLFIYLNWICHSCPNIYCLLQVSSLIASSLKGHLQHYTLYIPILLILNINSYQLYGRCKFWLQFPLLITFVSPVKNKPLFAVSFTDTRRGSFYYKNLWEAFKRHTSKG